MQNKFYPIGSNVLRGNGCRTVVWFYRDGLSFGMLHYADDGARNYAKGFDAWILAARSACNRPLRASSVAFTLSASLFLVFLLGAEETAS